MTDPHLRPVIVVGAGLAGLVAARTLYRAGYPVQVFESAGAVGGRVQSTRNDRGFVIDRGFQVILSAWPALQRQVDLASLDARPFLPGARVWTGRRLVPLVNPLRRPAALPRDLASPVFGIADQVRLARWAIELARAPWTTAAEAANDRPSRSALDAFRQRGFSADFIERFARPFWGGVLLDRTLSASAGVVDFTTKMLLHGDAVLLAGGAGTIPATIAADLPADAIRLSTRVDSLILEDGSIRGVRADGKDHVASAVIVATDPPSAAALTGIDLISTSSVGCVTVYLASNRDPGIGTALTLDGTGRQPVNHIAPLSAVQPSYAPAGRHLLAAVLLGDRWLHEDHDRAGEAARRSVATMLCHNADDWRVVDVVPVDYCFFQQPPGIHRRLPDANTGIPGLYLASDATVDASVNGAIMSGEDAAHAVRMAR